jgi:hypothetical protein
MIIMAKVWQERGYLRAIAFAALAYLLALAPVLSSRLQPGGFEAGLDGASAWTICAPDGSVSNRDHDGGQPAGHGHNHCALCWTLAAPLAPPTAAVGAPAPHHVAVAPDFPTAVLSLRHTGWSTSWSARAPPFAA